VTFNGIAANFSVISATTIQTTVPAGASTGQLRVTTPAGTATSATSFTVVLPPTITDFNPPRGRVGASVTIDGLNFTGATAVKFNGVAAAFSVTSATEIETTVPAGATTGPISVTNSAGTATSDSAFTVRVTLTVTQTGIRGGTVYSTPDGINCSSGSSDACSANFNMGRVVRLTPEADLLSIFTGWSGCDTVSGDVCIVTMSDSRNVIAHFLP
jgi:hypothetical protein